MLMSCVHVLEELKNMRHVRTTWDRTDKHVVVLSNSVLNPGSGIFRIVFFNMNRSRLCRTIKGRLCALSTDTWIVYDWHICLQSNYGSDKLLITSNMFFSILCSTLYNIFTSFVWHRSSTSHWPKIWIESMYGIYSIPIQCPLPWRETMLSTSIWGLYSLLNDQSCKYSAWTSVLVRTHSSSSTDDYISLKSTCEI